jgi:hypothetical protein
MRDESRIPELGVDPGRDTSLCEHAVGTAGRDGPDGALDVHQPVDGTDRDPVVHRDDDVASVCPDAREAGLESGGHIRVIL